MACSLVLLVGNTCGFKVRKGTVNKVNLSSIEIFKILLKLITLLFISYFFIIGTIEILNSYGINIPRPDKFDKTKDWSVLKLVFIAVVFAPIIEELVFRLPLRFSKFYIGLPLAFIIYQIIISIFDYDFIKLISFFFSSLIVFLSFSYLNDEKSNKIQKIWEQNILYVFYFFFLRFSFLHLKNHSKITLRLLLLSPLIILPKIVAGIIFSYARLKINIGSSIILHMINNGIATIFILLNR